MTTTSERHYLRTPLGLVLLACLAIGASLLIVQHALHFWRLMIEHQQHELMLIPYLLLVLFPLIAIFVYRHQDKQMRRRIESPPKREP